MGSGEGEDLRLYYGGNCCIVCIYILVLMVWGILSHSYSCNSYISHLYIQKTCQNIRLLDTCRDASCKWRDIDIPQNDLALGL